MRGGRRLRSRDADASIKSALTGAEVIIIPAGVPRKPGMT